MKAEPLFKERTVVVAGTRSRLPRRRALTLADLADEPWCLPPPDTFVGTQIVEAFRASGLAIPARP